MRTIFWNVDTQYDFMRNDESFKGALPVPDAKEIECNLEILTKLAKKNHIQVINTADYHTLDSTEISSNPDFKNTFPPHCLQGTKGSEFIPATSPETNENGVPLVSWVYNLPSYDFREISYYRNLIVYKDHFDVFKGNKQIDRILEYIKPDRAIVYGVATNICVDFAVKGLAKRNIEVYVVEDAIKELPGANLNEIYQEWEKIGVKLIQTNQVKKCVR
ncbi:MAG: isochorismatase family cysteine hydrolase [Nanoarchaeota archaeon]|nr:cysteine hydrolase [Nanoarchaeota archaeon]MBU1030986.1 cysteine hydrolase [Nanoarchaeota archaeon]MBU1849897.1 cysteine hydrolase [Nanoarchaeota archaeon]